MKIRNSVYIGTSIDGYIADKEGGIGFLDSIPLPKDLDMGYHSFMERIDALVMGKTTFETVLSFDIEWPYKKPVFVLSKSLKAIPEELAGKVEIVQGPLEEIIKLLNDRGYLRLYIDGGKTVQSFLQEDLIDEMIITVIPVLVGGGASLFGELHELIKFECVEVNHFVDKIVQMRYLRNRIDPK